MSPSFVHPIACSLEVLTRGKPWPQKKNLTSLLRLTLDQTLTHAFRSNDLPSFFTSFIEHPLEINLLLAHDSFVRTLNRKWRHKDSATNVLSFPTFEKTTSSNNFNFKDLENPILLGEIVLSYEKCLEEINLQKSFLNHVQHLFLHGTLHLLGFDHEDTHEAKIMETLEIEILQTLNIPNPYGNP